MHESPEVCLDSYVKKTKGSEIHKVEILNITKSINPKQVSYSIKTVTNN